MDYAKYSIKSLKLALEVLNMLEVLGIEADMEQKHNIQKEIEIREINNTQKEIEEPKFSYSIAS